MINPCKNCKDRHRGCHAECEAYLEFKEKCEIIRDGRYYDCMEKSYYVDKDRRLAKMFKYQNRRKG
jgi:hypothetical protein